MSDSDKIKNLLARGLERTLPEQVQHAYMQLAIHVDSLFAHVCECVEDRPGDEDLEYIKDRLGFMVAKNVRLRTKLQYGNKGDAQ